MSILLCLPYNPFKISMRGLQSGPPIEPRLAVALRTGEER
jgi:hypothetical protein